MRILLTVFLLILGFNSFSQCDVVIQPGTLQKVDVNPGVKFTFTMKNNGTTPFQNGTFHLSFGWLDSPMNPQPVWTINLNQPLQPGATVQITTPIFLKLSPDLTNVEDVYKISCKYGIHGFILTNTTVDKSKAPEKFRNTKMGGISGCLLKEKSRSMLENFQKINTQNKIVISAGGIDSNAEAKIRITLNAQVIQVYSGLVWW